MIVFKVLMVGALSVVVAVTGLDITGPPPASVWVKQSESVELTCTSDQPWQWCYWEVQTSHNPGGELKTKRFQTFQVSLTVLSSYNIFCTGNFRS